MRERERDSKMSSSKRKRDAEELVAAQSQLSQLQSELAECNKLDEAIRGLDAEEFRLALEVPRAHADERREMRGDLESVRRARERAEVVKSRRMAEGLAVQTILSKIEKAKSLIQDLSRPTYIDRVLSEGPPSTVEKEGLYKVQTRAEGGEPLYECCFPPGAQPPLPLSLAHHVFGNFLDDFNNVSAQLDDDVCNFVVQLCFNVLGRAQVFRDEADFQEAFNLKLEGFVGHTVGIVGLTCHTKKATTDLTVRAGADWTALGELKLERGVTLAQGLQSFAIYVGSRHPTTHLLPCFFIEVIGPTIRIGGLVFFEKVAWQPLTPFLNCFYTEHDRTDMATLCRAMRALKKGLTALGSSYREAHASVNTSAPKDIPYPLQGRRSDRLGKKLIFIVTRDDGERRVFKYCRQYGEEVHRSWAEAGWAPVLYGCKPIAGGWLEVEMQYLAEDWIPSSSLLKDMDEVARHELQASITAASKQALSILVDGCPVAHGDMRPPNVLIKRDDGGSFHVKFIDFDWAGKVGVARYPPFMNTELPWHPQVGVGKLLQQDHDTWWLADKPGAISPSNYHLLSEAINL